MASEVVALLPRRRGSNSFPAEITPVGLKIDEGIAFEAWVGIGATLQGYHAALPWLVGDWLSVGNLRWGEAHAQAIGDHYAPETLRTYQIVCEAIPLAHRKESLSFAHHQTVYKLAPDERDELLGRAAEGKWTRSMLRDEVDKRHPELRREPRTRKADPPPAPHGQAEASSSVVDDTTLIQNGNTHVGAIEETAEIPEPAQESGVSTPASIPPAELVGNSEQLPPSVVPNGANGIGPTTAEEAVDMLTSLPAGALPDHIMDAILLLTEERIKLLRVLAAAKETLTGYEPDIIAAHFPELAEAVSALDV